MYFVYSAATLASFWFIYQVRMRVSKVTKNMSRCTVDVLSDMSQKFRDIGLDI